jgi:hypothetical protein
MKKLSLLMLVFALSVFSFIVVSAASDYSVDMDGITAITGSTDANKAILNPAKNVLGFDTKSVSFTSEGLTWKITGVDLSQYSKVEITYGCDSGALFGDGTNTFIALTQNGATQDASLADTSAAAVVIAKSAELPSPEGGWSSAPTTVTIDLTGVTYSGDFYITYNMEKIGDRPGPDGIAISGVTFIGDSSSSSGSSQGTSQGSTQGSTQGSNGSNSSTGDNSLLLGAVVTAMFSVIVFARKKIIADN